MCDRNCGNCLHCLDDATIEFEFERVMKKSLISRINFCDCYMCNDPRSATCIEIDLYTNYNNPVFLLQTCIDKIKENYARKKRLFLLYLRCLGRFKRIYEDMIEKRYAPGGEGYLEAKARFEGGRIQ